MCKQALTMYEITNRALYSKESRQALTNKKKTNKKKKKKKQKQSMQNVWWAQRVRHHQLASMPVSQKREPWPQRAKSAYFVDVHFVPSARAQMHINRDATTSVKVVCCFISCVHSKKNETFNYISYIFWTIFVYYHIISS